MTAVHDPPAAREVPAERAARTRVAVIDRARTSRDALCRALAADHRLDVIDCGAEGRDALAQDQEFEAFLFHVSAPVPRLLEDVQAVTDQHPGATVVVVASYVDEDVSDRLRTHGATHVLTSDAALDDVLAAIVSAGDGRHHDPTRIVGPQRSRAGRPGLTDREVEVLLALSEGRSPQQIAHEAAISVSTVRDHLKHLRHKLDCASAVELVVTAHRLGLLPNLNRPLP